jgi:hypothetical protein
MAEPAPPSAMDRLTATQAALAETDSKIAELDQQRNQCLLQDDNAGAIELGIKITGLKLEVRAHEDKLNLLRSLAEKEAAERRAQEREAVIQNIEGKVDARDKVMGEVARAIKQLAAAAEKAININREIIAGWPWQPHDLAAALLTPPSIMAAISHEIFRISHHPRRFGGQDTDLAGISLPGSRSPRVEWSEWPERVSPMEAVVRQASEFAKNFLRTGRSSSAVEVVAGPAPLPVTNGGGEAVPRSPSQQRLSELLLQMSKLSEDTSPQGEQAYLDVVRQVAELQAEVTAEQQQVGARHG